jgi:hypothetical protein
LAGTPVEPSGVAPVAEAQPADTTTSGRDTDDDDAPGVPSSEKSNVGAGALEPDDDESPLEKPDEDESNVEDDEENEEDESNVVGPGSSSAGTVESAGTDASSPAATSVVAAAGGGTEPSDRSAAPRGPGSNATTTRMMPTVTATGR